MGKKPFVMTYIRKDMDNKDIPYAVGLFRFLSYNYVYIIPTFDESERDFSIQENYENFWKEFNHYYQVKGFTFMDLSGTNQRNIQISMSFTKLESNESV